MSTISPAARQELVTAVAERYQHSTAAEKGWILDEFVALTGYHRKHAIRVLNGRATMPTVPRGRRCVYDEAVTKGLIVLWEASDRMCGERRDHRPPSGTGAGRDCGSAPTSPFTPGRRARERAGAHLRRLEGPCAGLRRGRPRRALRQDDGRQCRLDAGAHRYRQRLDGVCACRCSCAKRSWWSTRWTSFAVHSRLRCGGSTPTTAATAWRAGEVRPTHRPRKRPPRHWRTRRDPLETTWPRVVQWLEAEPHRTAKELFERLRREHPGMFAPGARGTGITGVQARISAASRRYDLCEARQVTF